ncbi:MAG: hypothetical protein ACRETA_00170 [Gammaproteobacteria bacterium]
MGAESKGRISAVAMMFRFRFATLNINGLLFREALNNSCISQLRHSGGSQNPGPIITYWMLVFTGNYSCVSGIFAIPGGHAGMTENVLIQSCKIATVFLGRDR